MEQTQKNALIWCWLSLVIILLDQASKYLIVNHLTTYELLPILPFFNLTLMHNTGAAFSFLSQTGNLSTWIFSIVAIAVGAVLIFSLYRLPRKKSWLACALALILGGALGNLLDRFINGYVVDFLDFYYGNWHFAAFNLADSAITVGGAMLLIDMFFFQKETKEKSLKAK